MTAQSNYESRPTTPALFATALFFSLFACAAAIVMLGIVPWSGWRNDEPVSLTGLDIRDWTAGFMCYKRKVLETIELDKIKFVGYAFQIEMKYTTIKHGFKIVEVPVIFTDRTEGTSKMSTRIFREAFFGVIQMRINSIFRKYPEG